MKPWKRAEAMVVIFDRWRFNGATAMKPWKSSDGRQRKRHGYEWLQWGHGDEAVEETGAKARAVVSRYASMGPRR